MSLPIYIRGKVLINRDLDNKLTLESLRDNLVDSILQEEAKSVETKHDVILFQVGWFRLFLGWKLLKPISSGQIALHFDDNKIRVNCKVTFEHLVIVATVITITVMVLVPTLLANRSIIEDPFKLIFFLRIWLWLVCVNVLITRSDFSIY